MLSRTTRPTASAALRAPSLASQGCHPLPDCVQAEEQLPNDVSLLLDAGGRTKHPGLPQGQTETIKCVAAEARDLLLEQQAVRIAGNKLTMRRDLSRTLTSGGAAGERASSPTAPGSQPASLAAPKCSTSKRSCDNEMRQGSDGRCWLRRDYSGYHL